MWFIELLFGAWKWLWGRAEKVPRDVATDDIEEDEEEDEEDEEIHGF